MANVSTFKFPDDEPSWGKYTFDAADVKWNETIFKHGTSFDITWNTIPYAPTETMPPMTTEKVSKYPNFEINEISLDDFANMVNCRVHIEIVDTDSEGINAYKVNIETDENYKQGDWKYVGLTQELLEQHELIEPSENIRDLLHLGYIDCEVIGYVPLPYKYYLLRIIE